MIEINQPVPIKPIWPARREDKPKSHKQPEEPSETESDDSDEQGTQVDEQGSGFDGYA